MALTAFGIIVRKLLPMVVAAGDNNSNMIHPVICPEITGGSKSGVYYKQGGEKYDIPDLYHRAETVAAQVINLTLSKVEYNVQEKALMALVADEVIEETGVMGAVAMHVDLLVDVMKLIKEFIAAGYFFNESYMTNYITGGAHGGGHDFTQWSDTTNGAPRDDIIDGLKAFKLQGGGMPTHLFCGVNALAALQKHPQTLAFFQNQILTLPTPKQLADLYGIANVVVCDSVYNASGTKTFVWNTRNALLAKVDQMPKTYKTGHAIGGSIKLRLPHGGKELDVRPAPTKYHSVEVEIRTMDLPIVIDANCGYLFKNAAAA